MLYSEMKKNAAGILQSAGIEEYEVDAEYLLQCASGLERNELFIRWNEEIPCDLEEKYRALIDRRKAHEPLQYIIGNQDFMGYTFIVTPDVLIPRFDTEVLAELAIKRAEQAYKGMPMDSCGTFRMLDLCTGSGCVAISVGMGFVEKIACSKDADALRKKIEVIGADISNSALKVAQRNLELNWQRMNDVRFSSEDAGLRISFSESDLFKSINGKFHIITANPPYIVRDEIETLMPEITEHEPHLALDGGEDGMDFYRKIVCEAPDYLLPGGRLMMEFDDAEAESVAEMMEAAGFKDILIHKDLAGLRRVIEGKIHV